jgi:two-component system NtrC family response regulator
MPRILVIDDDTIVCETIESLLSRLQYQSRSAHTLEQGLQLLAAEEFDVVFLDVRLPDGNGLEALPRIRSHENSPEVIILTGEGDPDGAELAIQGGVWDYLVKPTPIKQTTLTLNRALQYRQEKLNKQAAPPVALNLDGVVGSSERIRESFDIVARAASTDTNVLITGETGTGKELFARTIHRNCVRAGGPFVVVDCASLTETLIESTLFGHKKGAFTGAEADQEGLAKLADGGTLFLDEVGEMPLSLQRSFLRFLQERTFRPVGGTQEVKSDFRLISATNRDLDAMVERGEFRKDLLFRLKTLHVVLPPLRQRLTDLKPLAMYYIDKLCEQYNVPNKGFSSDFFTLLARHDWPGNVRELFNVLERAFVASGLESMLYAMHLPQDLRIKAAKAHLLREQPDELPARGQTGCARNQQDADGLPCPLPDMRSFKHMMERKYLESVIARHKGDLPAILETSGLSRSHFYALLKKNNIVL